MERKDFMQEYPKIGALRNLSDSQKEKLINNPLRYEAGIRSIQSRKNMASRYLTTGLPTHQDIERMLDSQQEKCDWCGLRFVYTKGTQVKKEWKAMTVDRVDTGLGPTGSGRLYKFEENYEWLECPGYQPDNMKLLCFGCNKLKCTFEDKFNVQYSLFRECSMVPFVEMKRALFADFYGGHGYNNTAQKSDSQPEFKTALARYIHKREDIPMCPCDPYGNCELCDQPAPAVVYTYSTDLERWRQTCLDHGYPQNVARYAFETMFYRWTRSGLPLDGNVCLNVLASLPGPGQVDVLEAARSVAGYMLDNILPLYSIEDNT